MHSKCTGGNTISRPARDDRREKRHQLITHAVTRVTEMMN